jgi:hypothetical protein
MGRHAARPVVMPAPLKCATCRCRCGA